MKTGYFWPVYGELDEVCFPFFESRQHATVEWILGPDKPPDKAVMLSDGYGAYSAYTGKLGIVHALCWAHCRREFVKAESVEPVAAARALKLIGEIYRVEDEIRDRKLRGERKREYRLDHSRKHVEAFFEWAQGQLEAQAFLPSNRLTQALGYALERRHALSVHLTDPDVAVDTNHLERALRPIPLGRRNWMFAWTELGARQIGIAQSLIINLLFSRDPALRLSGRCPAAGQPAPGLTRRGTHPPALEDPLRSPANALGARLFGLIARTPLSGRVPFAQDSHPLEKRRFCTAHVEL